MNRIVFIISFILLSVSNIYAQQGKQSVYSLEYKGWTNDFEHIFTKEQVRALDSIIGNFAKQTTIEIAIVTLDSSFTTKENFDEFITRLGNYWGIGKKNKNNGIIIGISTGFRKIRISNGYGIEPKLSDSETQRIIDDVITPEFKKHDYYKGTREGLSAIITNLK